MAFEKLRSLLTEVFNETVLNEEELSHASATLVLASLFQLYVRAPQYALYKHRVISFNASLTSPTPLSSLLRQSPPLPSASEFASAGFFHTGREDETVCGVCGLGLRDWQPQDQADVSHARFSTASALTLAAAFRSSAKLATGVPCLFLAAHRLLASELPLARKNLGVVLADRPEHEAYVGNLTARLMAIATAMSLGGSNNTSTNQQNWPVQNARHLGYSDDLILLGLWRLQSDSASSPISFVPEAAMQLDPQDTTVLLKSILWVQESGLDEEVRELIPSRQTRSTASDQNLATRDESSGSASEEPELADLLRHRRRQQRTQVLSATSQSTPITSTTHLPAPRLPELAQFLAWWTEKQANKDVTLRPPADRSARKKANSTST